jgi:hypothetical protein
MNSKDAYLIWRAEVNLNRRIEALEKQVPSGEHKYNYESVAETYRWVEELLGDDEKDTTKKSSTR